VHANDVIEAAAQNDGAENYYAGKVFEYPAISEIGRAYPEDPNTSHLLSAAEKLVDGLYYPCRAAN
jgi:hypothetical protein